jgi:hypothetical protein
LFYSDIPLKEGVVAFEEKLAKIRECENREPLGLVLCGGSARAFAHIGVLKSLEENGIVPDFIVANSMGAIIGQLYAYGFSSESIFQIISEIDLTSYFDPVIPIHGGVINTRKFRDLINDLLGEKKVDISQCEIPILVITEDLISKRSKIMQELNVELDDMSMSELVDFIQKNPSVLKRPIILNERVFQVGYDQEEIDAFVPAELRRLALSACNLNCPNYNGCGKCREELH